MDMTVTPQPGGASAGPQNLAEFIVAHMDELLEDWNSFARTIVRTKAPSHQALQDHAREILEAAAADLVRPQAALTQASKSKGLEPDNSPALKLAGEKHAIGRVGDEFTLEQLIAEYRALRGSVMRRWSAQLPHHAGRPEEVTRFNECIDEALAASARTYAKRHDDARTVLLGMLAHDLRNPLNVAMLSAAYIIQDPTANAKTIQSAARLKRSIARCSELVSDLIDYACLELGPGMPMDPRVCNLQALCSVTIEEIEASHPGRVVIQSYASDLNGTWDDARIAQLVCNLLGNALTHGHTTELVTLSAWGSEDQVRLDVHNVGPTISAHELESLFIPAYLKPAPRAMPSQGSSGM